MSFTKYELKELIMECMSEIFMEEEHVKKNINVRVAEYIVKAQVASIIGHAQSRHNLSDSEIELLSYLNFKDEHDLKQRMKEEIIFDYKAKTQHIVEAINLIRHYKTEFDYYIIKAPDQNGYRSFIVYFDTLIDDEKIQVSFHTPYHEGLDNGFDIICNSGRRTRWNKDGLSSCEACIELIKKYDLQF